MEHADAIRVQLRASAGFVPRESTGRRTDSGMCANSLAGLYAEKYVWQCPIFTVAVLILLKHRYFCCITTHDDTYKAAPTMSVIASLTGKTFPSSSITIICYTRQSREERTLTRTLQHARRRHYRTSYFCSTSSTSSKLALLCRNTWPLQWLNQAANSCRAHTGAPSPDTGHQQMATP